MNALNDQLKTLRLSHAAKALEQQQATDHLRRAGLRGAVKLALESEILNRNQSKINA